MWFTTPDHPFKIASLKTKIKRRKNECECENGVDGTPNGRKWGGDGKKANWEFMNFNPGLFRYGRRCSSVQNLDIHSDNKGKEFRRCISSLGELKPGNESSLEVPPKEIRGRTFPNMRNLDPSAFICEESSFLLDLYRKNNLRASEYIRRNFADRNFLPLSGSRNSLDGSQKYKSEFDLSSAQQKVRRSSFFLRSNPVVKKKNSLREQDEDEMEIKSQDLNSESSITKVQGKSKSDAPKNEKKSKGGKRNKRKKEEKKNVANGQNDKPLNSNKNQPLDKGPEKSRVSRMFGGSGFTKSAHASDETDRERNRGNGLIMSGSKFEVRRFYFSEQKCKLRFRHAF